MTPTTRRDRPIPPATDGEIAIRNLESSCRRGWARFRQDPRAPGVAEALAEMERLKLEFLGDPYALDRLDMLALQFERAENSFRTALVAAEVASTAHRFAEARDHLAQAQLMGASYEDTERQALAIDQACNVALDDVLAARCRIAAASGQLEELVPLGALLADLERFAEADAVYREALGAYDGTTPFPLAWTCFQLGMLWGELVPRPDPDLATRWYRCALTYVPDYTKARVHLAEVHAGEGHTTEAEALLLPALPSGDPEVSWRLADVLNAQGRHKEAEVYIDVARRGFDTLLSKYPLAFADHGAEFYAGRGNDPSRALSLALQNVANRPTRRAARQARAIATGCAKNEATSALRPIEWCHAGEELPYRKS